MLKLNLGCANNFLEQFVNIDKYEHPLPVWCRRVVWEPKSLTMDSLDGSCFVKLDLNKFWYGITDSSVSDVRAHDIIEHLPNKIHTMNEIWRVLKPGSIVDIFVPTTDGRGAWQDQTHCSWWNENSFFYYTVGVPEYERFHVSYGIKGGFKVLSKETREYPNSVSKLRIILEAVK